MIHSLKRGLKVDIIEDIKQIKAAHCCVSIKHSGGSIGATSIEGIAPFGTVSSTVNRSIPDSIEDRSTDDCHDVSAF